MNITELITQFREESGDDTAPFAWGDTVLVRLFNEAIEEACKRKPLIVDESVDAVCEIALVANTASYVLHSAVVTVIAAYVEDSDEPPLKLIDRDEMERIDAKWRALDPDTPKYMIVEQNTVRLVPAPSVNGTLKMEVWRLPITSEKITLPGFTGGTQTPAISGVHHKHLYHWVMAVLYHTPDTEEDRTGQAEMHRSLFNTYFGLSPDADMKRGTRENRPHRNQLW